MLYQLSYTPPARRPAACFVPKMGGAGRIVVSWNRR